MKGNKSRKAVSVLFIVLTLCLSFPLLSLAEKPATGDQGDVFSFLEQRSDDAFDPLEKKIEGFAGSGYRLLRTVVFALGVIGFFFGLIKVILGGRLREEGKAQIAWAMFSMACAGAAIWALNTSYGIGNGL